MSQPQSIRTLLREHKALLIVMIVGIILLEVEIFAFAALKTGRKSVLEIRDKQGNLIHVTDGDHLSSFNKYYFEQTFGPLTQYQTRLAVKDRPFPFRAWFAAAVGIPVGAVLLFGFVVRAYLAIVHGDVLAGDTAPHPANAPGSRLQRIIGHLRRTNVFILGAGIFLLAAGYWIVPNMITYLGRASLDTIIRYKWIFLPAATVLAAIVVWIIYLRYLLARAAIASQAEVEKYQLRLTMENTAPLALTHDARSGDSAADAANPATGNPPRAGDTPAAGRRPAAQSNTDTPV